MVNFVIGAALIVLAITMFIMAIPKKNGVVRPFLRNDAAQGLYAVIIVFIGAAGLILIIMNASSIF